MHIHDSDFYVRQIQSFLLEISYAEDNLPHIVPDGIYGDETKEAVMIFQKDCGLPETGCTDYETFTHLYESYLSAVIKNGRRS